MAGDFVAIAFSGCVCDLLTTAGALLGDSRLGFAGAVLVGEAFTDGVAEGVLDGGKIAFVGDFFAGALVGEGTTGCAWLVFAGEDFMALLDEGTDGFDFTGEVLVEDVFAGNFSRCERGFEDMAVAMLGEDSSGDCRPECPEVFLPRDCGCCSWVTTVADVGFVLETCPGSTGATTDATDPILDGIRAG